MHKPKARRDLLGRVKDFRPISLTSFILKPQLKLMGTLVDRYIREVPLVKNPLHRKIVRDCVSKGSGCNAC